VTRQSFTQAGSNYVQSPYYYAFVLGTNQADAFTICSGQPAFVGSGSGTSPATAASQYYTFAVTTTVDNNGVLTISASGTRVQPPADGNRYTNYSASFVDSVVYTIQTGVFHITSHGAGGWSFSDPAGNLFVGTGTSSADISGTWPITPPSCQVQVKPLLQDDPSWGGNIYDTSGSTIAHLGCALTSLVMALRYAGLSAIPIQGTTTSLDPGSLNLFLDTLGGYSGSKVNWGVATRLASFFSKASPPLKFNNLGGNKTPSTGAAQALKSVLCASATNSIPHPVIVGVNLNAAGEPGHFVLVTGIVQNADGSDKFLIDDPFYPTVSLDDYHNEYVTRGFVADPIGDISELDIDIGRSADVLLTDPTGAQTGLIDSTTAQDVQEIPQSAHFVDRLDDDITLASDTHPGHFISVFQPIFGSYTLSVTGVELGQFSVGITAFSQDGSPQPPASVPGISGVGSSATFQIQFSIAAGAVPTVVRSATYETTLSDIANAMQLGLIDNITLAKSLARLVHAAARETQESDDAREALHAFKRQVIVQSGKHITGVAAQVLLEDANSLLSQLPKVSD